MKSWAISFVCLFSRVTDAQSSPPTSTSTGLIEPIQIPACIQPCRIYNQIITSSVISVYGPCWTTRYISFQECYDCLAPFNLPLSSTLTRIAQDCFASPNRTSNVTDLLVPDSDRNNNARKGTPTPVPVVLPVFVPQPVLEAPLPVPEKPSTPENPSAPSPAPVKNTETAPSPVSGIESGSGSAREEPQNPASIPVQAVLPAPERGPQPSSSGVLTIAAPIMPEPSLPTPTTPTTPSIASRPVSTLIQGVIPPEMIITRTDQGRIITSTLLDPSSNSSGIKGDVSPVSGAEQGTKTKLPRTTTSILVSGAGDTSVRQEMTTTSVITSTNPTRSTVAAPSVPANATGSWTRTDMRNVLVFVLISTWISLGL